MSYYFWLGKDAEEFHAHNPSTPPIYHVDDEEVWWKWNPAADGWIRLGRLTP